MRAQQTFNVRNGVQYDMSLHGSRFILIEFSLAAVLLLVLLLFSTNMADHTPVWPWWLAPWLVICAGMALNYITMFILAWQIARSEGARPRLPDQPHVEYYNRVLPLLIVAPLVLPILTWLHREK